MKRIVKIFCLILCLSFAAISHATHSASYARPASWSTIKHVVIIILENTAASEAVQQPFMKSLLAQGAYTDNLFAITHPSQPNYFALIAGDTFNATDSNKDVDANHIGNLLNAKGKTWKQYAENYPGHCYLKKSASGHYVRKHAPFVSFLNVQTNPQQCENLVSADQFFADIAAHNLPTYAFYVPNNLNNGHDTGVAYADKWLKNTFSDWFANQDVLKDTLFIVTFDEDDHTENNKIYTLLIGAGVKVGAVSKTHHTLYSLLKTIEQIFELDSLNRNDKDAKVIDDIWLP